MADYRILVPHEPDCSAVAAVERGDWPTPWGPPHREHPVVFATAAGALGRSGHRQWLQIICNSMECNAVLMLRLDAALALVPREVSLTKYAERAR